MNQAVNPTAHPGRVGCQCCLLGWISWPTISRWTRLSTRKTSSSKLASPNANQAQLPAGYPKAQSPPNKAPSTRTSKAVSRDRPVSPLLLLIPSLLPHVIDPTSHPRKERAARSDRRDGRRVRPAPAPASPRGAAPAASQMAAAAGGQQPMKRPRPADFSGSIFASVPLPTLDLIRAASRLPPSTVALARSVSL
jgi:hypothetical protein